MENRQAAAKKLARNTMYMYIRMIFILGISLFTSRVILEKLGVSDYGIYNLVGSVIALFASVRALFSSAIQRFMTTEMGRGGDKLNLIFNTSIQNNIILSFVFVVIIEIVGLWFLKYKVNIAEDRMFAAHCVFQLSVCGAVIGIMAVPYNAVIIAHERMDVYSFFSITEAILNLLILYLLSIGNFDKLIFYAVLSCLVQLLMRAIYVIYCKYHYSECKFRWVYDKSIFKEMLTYSGWLFLGNTAFMMTRNTLNMMLNVFGSTVVNAAWGVAHQVDAGLRSFANNLLFSFHPHCQKLYGEGKLHEMNSILFMMSKVLFVLQFCLLIPVVYFTEEICSIWLTVTPDHTIAFIRLMLLWTLVRAVHNPIDMLFKAHGKLRDYQITESIMLSLPLLFSYFALRRGMVIESVFIISILFEIINLFLILKVAKKDVGLNLSTYFRLVIFPCLFTSIGPALVTYYYFSKSFSFLPSMMLPLLSIILCIGCMYVFGLSKAEKESVLQMKGILAKKFHLKRK